RAATGLEKKPARKRDCPPCDQLIRSIRKRLLNRKAASSSVRIATVHSRIEGDSLRGRPARRRASSRAKPWTTLSPAASGLTADAVRIADPAAGLEFRAGQ